MGKQVGWVYTANLLSFGKEKNEMRKLTYTNIISSPKGDFCVFTTMEGDNYIFIQRTRSVENLTKLRRIINALKFVEVINEEERSVIKFICSSSIGTFSSVVLSLK